MGGWSKCQCCKQNKLMTEHHVKSINEKMSVCDNCHKVITEYEKYVNILTKEKKAREAKTPKSILVK